MGLRRDDRADADRPACDLERVRAVAAGGIVPEELPPLLPPRPAVVRAELAEPTGALDDVALAAELVEPFARAADGTDAATATDDAPRRRSRRRAASPSAPRSSAREPLPEPARRSATSPSAAAAPSASASANQPPARSRAAARLEILDETVLRRRPAATARRRRRSRDEHREPLEPVGAQREPEAHAERGDDDPRPRVREHERDLGDIEEEHAAGPHSPSHGDARRRATDASGSATAQSSASAFQ